MAEQSPFQPTIDDVLGLTQGNVSPQMLQQGYGMGADIAPKPGLMGYSQGNMGPFGILGAALLGMRMRRPANQNVAMPMLDSPQAQPRGGNPAHSQVGRLNALNPQQFQVYLDARARNMTPEQAMQLAQGQQ